MPDIGNPPAASLNEEHQAACALLDLLQQEQSHLIAADVDPLAALTEEKARIVARMTELATIRHQRLAAAGFEASEAGMGNWLKQHAASSAAADSWNALLTAARSAKELNRVNGLLIGQHVARNQNALRALQGSTPGAGIYGPDGHAATRLNSRKIIAG